MFKQTQFRRLAALTLSILMVISLMPTTVLATESSVIDLEAPDPTIEAPDITIDEPDPTIAELSNYVVLMANHVINQWEDLQVALDNAADGDVFDLSNLATPLSDKVYAFLVGDNKTITLKGGGTQINNVAFVFGSNNNITIEDLNIKSAYIYIMEHDREPEGFRGRSALHFEGMGNVLTLSGDNTITNGGGNSFPEYGAGVGVPEAASLIINGDGSLEAYSTNHAAAIGGGGFRPAGSIIIQSGTITAIASEGGAGIGPGALNSPAESGNITIEGGTITANSESGAGIGGSAYRAFSSNVIITGGIINASSKSGAGIGSGNNGVNSGNITINGGTVTTTSTAGGAGIGSGNNGDNSGNITINGGTVTTSSTAGGAGIGGGNSGGNGGGNGGSIAISGGIIVATGSNSRGAGIGGGDGGNGGEITITGGTVTTEGGSNGGAGIGGGHSGDGGKITISGGTVIATGGINGCAGIGGGTSGDGGEINISGGTVIATGGFGAGIGGGYGGDGGAVTINGGSVNATGGVGADAIGKGFNAANSGTLKNGSGDDVFLSVLTIEDKKNSSVTAADFDGNSYGINDVRTDADGKLYFYLTKSDDSEEVAVTIDDTEYIADYERETNHNNEHIMGLSIKSAVITYTDSFVYTGTEIKPEVTVTLDGQTLTLDDDYTVQYINNIEVGTATIIIKGTGDYLGTIIKTFSITKKTLSDSDLDYDTLTDHVYDGTEHGVGAVTLAGSPATDNTVGGLITVKYNDSTTVPTDAGSYSVTVEISGGTRYEEETISLGDYSITKAQLTISSADDVEKVYDGTTTANINIITFEGLKNGETLALTDDYTVTDAEYDTANVGTGKTVTGTVVLVGNGPVAKNYNLGDGSLNITTGVITPLVVDSINDTIEAITKTAYEVRSAQNNEGILSLVTLPDAVEVTTENGATLTLPITWEITGSFNSTGATYNVTGTLTGNNNTDTNNVTASTTITITPVKAENPTFGDTTAYESADNSATAGELGGTVLPTSGSIIVEGETINYTIDWDGGETLDRTGTDNEQTFTGTISYPPEAPAWLTLPASDEVTRKVTVTGKEQTDISGLTVGNKVYDAVAYAPEGTVSLDTNEVAINELVWKWESTDGSGYNSATAPTNAGDYKLTISVRDSHATHFGSEEFTFSITKRPVTVKADDKRVANSGTMPVLTYSVVGQLSGETALVGNPIIRTTATGTRRTGTYPITVDLVNVSYTANYTAASPAYENGTLTVSAQSGDIGVDPTNPSVDPSADPWENPFIDVDRDDWFYGDVEYVAKNGLFYGTSETTFSPDMPMTRGMLVTVLWRMIGEPEPSTLNSFEDVESGMYYEKAIAWAAEKDVVLGYGNGMFGPNDSMTREQMVTVMHRYAGLPAPSQKNLQFVDAGKISFWAYDAVAWATGTGIVNGKPGGLFDPQGGATRAEVAAVFHRFLEQ